MHALLSCHIYSTFSLLSNVTLFLFSLFFPFQLTIQISLVTMMLLFPYSWELLLFIPQLNPWSFPFLPLFLPTILFAAGIQPTPTTYCSLSFDRVQVGSIPLLGFTTNFLIFLVKDSLPYTITSLSFPKMVKPSLILCLHFLECIRWFQPTFSPFFGKDVFPVRHSQKRAWRDIRSRPFPPSTKPHLLHLIGRGPYSIAWLGCKRAKPRPYLTHMPCYFCFFSVFGFFILHALPLLLLFSFIVSFIGDRFGLLSFYTKGFGPLWAKYPLLDQMGLGPNLP